MPVKRTVLAMTQKILSSMNSDEINSVTDTEEASQVAEVIIQMYEDILSSRYWPHLRRVTTLTALADATRPTMFEIPTNIAHIYTIKYNKKAAAGDDDLWVDVIYKAPEEFMDIVNARSSSASNVLDSNDMLTNMSYMVKTDVAPTYWTTMDQKYAIFDAYDSDVDSTLQESKQQVFAYVYPDLSAPDDATVVDLPLEEFSRLMAEAKLVAFDEIKERVPVTTAQAARRQQLATSRRLGTRHHREVRNYGRK